LRSHSNFEKYPLKDVEDAALKYTFEPVRTGPEATAPPRELVLDTPAEAVSATAVKTPEEVTVAPSVQVTLI
jgi:hypothetical protein